MVVWLVLWLMAMHVGTFLLASLPRGAACVQADPGTQGDPLAPQ
jgi:hypothetical protein